MPPTHSKHHPSIAALLRAEGSDDAEAAIRRRAQKLVAAAIEKGWAGPPFDVYELARRCGLTVSESSQLLETQDAFVTPGHIVLNSRKSKARRRYSVGHEIVHTLFPDYAQVVALAKLLWRDTNHSDFERLCQIGAAEIMFPSSAFASALETTGLSLRSVLSLSTTFDASVEATMRRAVYLATIAVTGVVLHPCTKERDRVEFLIVDPRDTHHPRTQLGIAFACSSNNCPAVSFPRGSLAPNGSAPDRAWKRASSAKNTIVIREAIGDWPCTESHLKWRSEATTLPLRSSHPNQVLSLLYPVM